MENKKENPMNHFSSPSPRHFHPRFSFRGLAVAAVIGVCGMVGSVAVQAQATAGHIFGKAPAGDTVRAKSTTNGMQRHVEVDEKGRYMLSSLPVGVYTVTLEENGKPVVKHLNVGVIVGRGIKVDFDCTQGECGQLANNQ
jgi:hypothetical protein